jgi:hypothetical protein
MLYDTPELLHQLTGYRRTADQVRWCERNGVRFMRKAGRRGIIVALAWVEAAGVVPAGRRPPRLGVVR